MLHLNILSGARKGESIKLEPHLLPLTIGRDIENRLCLEGAAISRFHARIVIQAGTYYIEDLNSTNGTFLNGRRITREKLGPGDEIMIANVTISVEAGPTAAGGKISPINLHVSIEKPVSLEKTVIATRPSDGKEVKKRLQKVDRSRIESSPEALKHLYKLDEVLEEIEDLNALLERLLDLLMETIPSTRGYVFLCGGEQNEILLHARRIRGGADPESEIVLSRTIVDEVLQKSYAVFVNGELISEIPKGTKPLRLPPAISTLAAPMRRGKKNIGIVSLDTWKAPGYTMDDLELLDAMCAKAANAVENSRLYRNLKNLFYNIVETLIRTMQAKDRYTSGHSTRVSRFSLLTAEKLGLGKEEKTRLYLAAMLHDIGKIGLPDRVLLRPGKLSREELEMVRRHPMLGVSMIKSLGEMEPIIPVILHHHEAFDGSGYPGGLVGEEIPLLSRIIAVADTYDAITSDRPYRMGRSKEEAIKEIKRVAGIKLDPVVVKAFLQVLEEISPADIDTAAELII